MMKIAGVDEVAGNEMFLELFEGIFSCRSNEELKQFSIKVKVKKPEFYRNIKYYGLDTDMTTLGKIYKWKHNDTCIGFRAKVNILLQEGDYTCPTCNVVLPRV